MYSASSWRCSINKCKFQNQIPFSFCLLLKIDSKLPWNRMEQMELQNSSKLEVLSISFSYLFPTTRFRPITESLSYQPFAWFWTQNNPKREPIKTIHQKKVDWFLISIMKNGKETTHICDTYFQTMAFSDALYFALPFRQINCTPDVFSGVGIFTSIFWPNNDGLKFDLSTTLKNNCEIKKTLLIFAVQANTK